MSERYHVATFSQSSGISRYAEVFHELVLGPRGYQRIDTGGGGVSSQLSRLTADDVVHFEVGVNEHSTVELLTELVARGFGALDVTMHDPPFLRWPRVRFRNALLTQASKGVQLLLRNLGLTEVELRRVRRLFVLTEAGRHILQHRNGLPNIHYLPFAVPVHEVSDPVPAPPNMLFFGFIAPNKGLDYALSLHAAVRVRLPATRLIVVGDAIAEAGARYLTTLQTMYQAGVEYCGFVEQSKLKTKFSEASVVVLPFRSYRSVMPASASILEAMARGKVVAASDVNAVRQFIRHGETGYLLTGTLLQDVELMVRILSEPEHTIDVAQRGVEYLRRHHNPTVVGQAFDAATPSPSGRRTRAL